MKILKRIVFILLALFLLFFAWFFYIIQIPEPETKALVYDENNLEKISDTSYRYEDAWLKKNKFGLWEMYISGSPEELGIKNGILAKDLIHKQEEAFVNQIKKMIPSESYLKFLKYITSFMNHRLPDYIPLQYQREIKALSLFASDDFQFIGDNYARQLNYHAAHDIGHAMQNLHLVECTAFGVRDDKSVDSSLLIGRNFDFYVGDEFAKNKIVLFVNPDKGYSFASITWAGMIGVVSGLNDQGLSITLNSAKSQIPLFAKTPVSIIAREILQYASNINEAYDIARRHPSFVAESFFISSAKDHNFAVIEKSPDTTILFQPNKHQLVLTNHFQSEALFNTAINQENIEENVTEYRFERVEELLAGKKQFDEFDFANILRDTKGQHNIDIGLGNEGAVNQLIAHHSIIFKPEDKSFWISSHPYQLGVYVHYQLDSVFNHSQMNVLSVAENNMNIPADSSFLKNDYLRYLNFVKMRNKLEKGDSIAPQAFVNSNPNYFYTYELLGNYFKENGEYKQAEKSYRFALQLFIPNKYETKRIQEKLLSLKNSSD